MSYPNHDCLHYPLSYLISILELSAVRVSSLTQLFSGVSKGPARPLGGVRGVPAILSHPAARGGAREIDLNSFKKIERQYSL